MNDLTSAIAGLDDAMAERILAVVAKHRLRPDADSVTSLDAELAAALVQASGQTPPSAGSPGDLARATLLLLADDPARRAELDALVQNPPAESLAFDPVAMIALSGITLLALQSYIKIEYDDTKGWRVKIEKQAMDKTLLAKVIGYLSSVFTQASK